MTSFRQLLAATTTDPAIIDALVADPDPHVADAARVNGAHRGHTPSRLLDDLAAALADPTGTHDLDLAGLLEAINHTDDATIAGACAVLAAADLTDPDVRGRLDDDGAHRALAVLLSDAGHLGIGASAQVIIAAVSDLAVDGALEGLRHASHPGVDETRDDDHPIRLAAAVAEIAARASLSNVAATFDAIWPTTATDTIRWVRLVRRCRSAADRAVDHHGVRRVLRWCAALADDTDLDEVDAFLAEPRSDRLRVVARLADTHRPHLLSGPLRADGDPDELAHLATDLLEALDRHAGLAIAARVVAHPNTPPAHAACLALEAIEHDSGGAAQFLRPRIDDRAFVAATLIESARPGRTLIVDELLTVGIDADVLADAVELACNAPSPVERSNIRADLPRLLVHAHPETIRHTWADMLTGLTEDATAAQLAWLGARIGDVARSEALDALARGNREDATIGDLLDIVDALEL